VPITKQPDFESSFNWCHNLAKNNAPSAVLLSPACASFGWFANYKARGEAFNLLVEQLP
jgi:UDP-N-acetylmuramoylalanine--D-glutamate ligase